MSVQRHVQQLLGLALTALVWSSPTRRDQTMVYDFKAIEPSAEISWTPCFDTYECMMLQVPLDYSDPVAGQATIAFVKLPSSEPDAQDILYNPGGPGFSGINDVLDYPLTFTNLLGSSYNVIGFDPRGVGNSSIDLDCFAGNDGAKVDFYAEVQGSPVDSTSEITMRETYTLNRGWGERCTQIQDPKQPKKYANTVATANDMRHYTELRAKEMGLPVEDAKLWYYGASYGTILGQVFATMWPEKVGRMVVDGVVDTDDYMAGGWLTVLADTDAALMHWFEDCLFAGSQLCPFAGNSTTAAELDQRFRALVDELNHEPLLVNSSLTFTPVTVDGQDVKRSAVTSLYGPARYLDFALSLFELEVNKNGTLLAAASGKLTLRMPPPQLPEGERFFFVAEATSQIACIDQNGRYDLATFDRFVEHVEKQKKTSWVGGEMFATQFSSSCVGYGVRAPDSQVFQGPIGSNTTNFPILFVSTTLDPVAPLRSATKQSSQFAGSAVLEINGTAHCGYSLPSDCLSDHVQAYFANASLPPQGAICDPAPASKPFYVPTE